jgi:NADH-quinone oxidoreductase subunit K
MGSERVPRVGFGVAPKQSLLCISRTVGAEKPEGKFANAMTPTLQLFVMVSVALFSIGLLAALSRRHAIFILIGIEMMLAAANLNFIAFWRFAPPPHPPTGVMIAIFSIAISAAEAAVGLAMVIAVYRHFRTTNVDQYDQLKG